MNTLQIWNSQCFTSKEVKEINKEIKKYKWEHSRKGDAKDTSKIGNFFHVPCSSVMEIIYPWLEWCQTINMEEFGYDVYWNYRLEHLNYNVYGIEGEYDWHIDAISEKAYDIKLTCLLNLSEEPYEGGEFHLINSKEKIKFDSGMGLIFHSMIAHKVTPVTKGERTTLTYFGIGSSWK